MEKLKRVPPPYPQDHPRAELLKHKGLAVMAQPKDNVSGSRQFLDWAEAQLARRGAGGPPARQSAESAPDSG